jgi:predicted DNA-binding transcriptional regulator AlpA
MPAEPILPIRPEVDPAPTDALAAPPSPKAERPAPSDSELPPLLLNADQAAALCGVSAATWYRFRSAGRCPAPLILSRGCVRWRAQELRDWIAAGCPDRKTWEALRNVGGRTRQAGR